MDVEKLSESVKKIKMSEESKKRIAQKCLEESQRRNEGLLSTVTRPKAGRKIFRVTAAAVLILCSATAVMAGSGIFKNPSVVKDIDEIRKIESEGEYGGYSVSGPNSPTPHSLEEMTESRRFKSDGWTSKDTMGGSVWNRYYWTDMEVIDNEGDLRERNIYSDKRDIKKEYTAENPLLLQEFMKGEAYIDLAELNELYNYVPDANVLYYVEDKRGNYEEFCFDSLYADSEGKSYFSLEYWHHEEADNDSISDYIPQSSYDVVYKYVNASGAEFIIQTYGDCVWATCDTEHSYICLCGGYMQTDEIEAVLDCISFEQ
ncbi:MAG: hypothetical protein Q3W84_03390 [Eubacteriales bacterium]|nr:hypothetical protein [Eubacteriales bacterium]